MTTYDDGGIADITPERRAELLRLAGAEDAALLEEGRREGERMSQESKDRATRQQQTEEMMRRHGG